jgi:hypothetical protein
MYPRRPRWLIDAFPYAHRRWRTIALLRAQILLLTDPAAALERARHWLPSYAPPALDERKPQLEPF